MGAKMTETSQRLFTQNGLSEIIKSGSVLASIAAILFLYGFGITAKINMLVYVSFTDYLKVAIGWIVPAIGLGGLIGLFIPDFVSFLRPSKGMEPYTKTILCELERNMTRFLKFMLIFLIVLITLLILAFLFEWGLKHIFQLSTYFVISCYSTALLWYIKSADLNKLEVIVKKIYFLCYWVPFLIFSIGAGLTHGIIDKTPNLNNRDSVTISSSNGSQLFGELLFSLDKFIVIRENGRSDVTFLPSDRVISIRTPASIPSQIKFSK
jgi:hypothetical protein